MELLQNNIEQTKELGHNVTGDFSSWSIFKHVIKEEPNEGAYLVFCTPEHYEGIKALCESEPDVVGQLDLDQVRLDDDGDTLGWLFVDLAFQIEDNFFLVIVKPISHSLVTDATFNHKKSFVLW